MRPIRHRYRDPLDVIWLEAARRIGLSIARSDEVYASTDGHGTLAIGTDRTLDPDDCLAQIVLHEFCHSLVQGPDSFSQPDWGLCNQSPRDVELEHACLRVQAALAAPYGLRWVLAPTTDFRAFYDELPSDPLGDDESSTSRAQIALLRAAEPPWAPHLYQALRTTRDVIASAFAHGVPVESLLSRFEGG